MLYAQDLSATQGEDRTYGPFIFASADPSGLNNVGSQVYYNFTGAHARMQVRQNEDSGSAEILALTDSAGGGIVFSSAQTPGGPVAPATHNAITVTIPKATSLTLAPGVYYFELFVDWASGLSQVFISGTFTVLPTVTR